MDNKAYIVADMGFGDGGKGTIVDYLVRKYKASAVIRYNGGPQAAHHVFDPTQGVHCFSQFGSGTFVAGAQTFLSGFMLIDPLAMIKENETLRLVGVNDALERVTIDGRCSVVTPFHKIINRMLEISRGNNKVGTCGMGVGQAVLDGVRLGNKMLHARDLLSILIMKEKLSFLQHIKVDIAEQIQEENPNNKQLSIYLEQIKRPDYVPRLIDEYIKFSKESGVKIKSVDDAILRGKLVFEGAQGALLDVKYGFYPYITKTRTTFRNANKLVQNSVHLTDVFKVGVIRAYSTRHGAGPFVTEDADLTKLIPDTHNSLNQWQGKFRVGWLDLVATKYAIEIGGKPNSVALTNLDRLNKFKKIKVCTSYEYRGEKSALLDKYFEWELVAGAKIVIRGLKKISVNKSERRQFTQMLFDCFPFEFKKFQGWKTDLSNVATFEDLPKQAKDYIDFLQSEEGINIPISIISIGPKWTDKIEL